MVMGGNYATTKLESKSFSGILHWVNSEYNVICWIQPIRPKKEHSFIQKSIKLWTLYEKIRKKLETKDQVL